MMKRSGLRDYLVFGCLVFGLFLTATAGCQPQLHPATLGQEVEGLFEDLGALLSLNQQRVRIGITNAKVDWLKPPPWTKLQADLKKKLGRGVQFRPLYPWQAQLQLALGRIDFAMVSTGAYVTDLSDENLVEVLAIPVSTAHGSKHRGVLLASAESDIKKVGDLAGQRFAFGPRGDAILHYAAIAALEEGGVKVSDIKREVLPIPGSLQFHISGIEAAKAAVHVEGTFACVVEEGEYNGWPDTGGTLIPLKIAKDQVRVIGHTPYMPAGVVLARKNADPELVKGFKEYLLSEAEKKKPVLASMGWSGFEPADDEKLAAARRLAVLAKETGVLFAGQEEGLPPPDESVLESPTP